MVNDVYIVFKSWKGAQGQGPSIDLVFVYRWLRLIPMVYGAKSRTVYNFGHHINM